MENVIEHIKSANINEELSQHVEYTTGNFITIAMECSDKDEKVKKLRETLKKNISSRMRDLEKEEDQQI